MDLKAALLEVAENERSGVLKTRFEVEDAISAVFTQLTGRQDILDQEGDQSDEDFEIMLEPILPIVAELARAEGSAKEFKVRLCFLYMDAYMLLPEIKDRGAFVNVWYHWLGWESSHIIAAWHSEDFINDQYRDFLTLSNNEGNNKQIAERYIDLASKTDIEDDYDILVKFAQSFYDIAAPARKKPDSGYPSVYASVSYNPPLLAAIKSAVPRALNSDMLVSYPHMSKEDGFKNDSTIYFTPEDMIFVPARGGITSRSLKHIVACDIGDQHNTFSYGFDGQNDTYFFDLYWTMSFGDVFTTRNFAGSSQAEARSYFNRVIKPLVTHLSPYIDFSSDGGHRETSSGSQIRISYSVWF